MNEPLQQITNIHLANQNTQHYQRNNTTPQIQDIIQLTLPQIDFGFCLPNSIHQRKVGLILKYTHKFHIIISLKITIQDQQLTDLSDYIFGVRKQNSYEYFDDYRFKATQKGIYNFIVGVKTPELIGKNISGCLTIKVQDYQGLMKLNLKQNVTIPKIICLKQLVNNQGIRIIKIGIMASKSKRQIKINFKYDQQIHFHLQTELLSLEQDNKSLEVRPKTIQPTGKGIFLLSLIASYPQEKRSEIWIQRRILTLKIKDTNAYYHFPVQVTFYPENKKNQVMLE